MSEVVFFLLGAMTIVEIVDSHQGKYIRDNQLPPGEADDKF